MQSKVQQLLSLASPRGKFYFGHVLNFVIWENVVEKLNHTCSALQLSDMEISIC